LHDDLSQCCLLKMSTSFDFAERGLHRQTQTQRALLMT